MKPFDDNIFYCQYFNGNLNTNFNDLILFRTRIWQYHAANMKDIYENCKRNFPRKSTKYQIFNLSIRYKHFIYRTTISTPNCHIMWIGKKILFIPLNSIKFSNLTFNKILSIETAKWVETFFILLLLTQNYGILHFGCVRLVSFYKRVIF